MRVCVRRMQLVPSCGLPVAVPAVNLLPSPLTPRRTQCLEGAKRSCSVPCTHAKALGSLSTLQFSCFTSFPNPDVPLTQHPAPYALYPLALVHEEPSLPQLHPPAHTAQRARMGEEGVTCSKAWYCRKRAGEGSRYALQAAPRSCCSAGSCSGTCSRVQIKGWSRGNHSEG